MVLWAFPLRMAVLDLDTTPLANLDEPERSWLEAKVPLAEVGTVAETLKKVQLSPALMKDVDRLIAAIEISDLVKAGLNPPDRDVEANILTACSGRRTSPRPTSRSRPSPRPSRTGNGRSARRPGPGLGARSARSQAQIAQHERQMQAVRDRILRDARGVKEQTVTARVIDPGLEGSPGPADLAQFQRRGVGARDGSAATTSWNTCGANTRRCRGAGSSPPAGEIQGGPGYGHLHLVP